MQRRILRSVMQDLMGTTGMDGTVEFDKVEAAIELLRTPSSRIVQLPRGLLIQLVGHRVVLKRGAVASADVVVAVPGSTRVPDRQLTLQTRVLPASVFGRLRPSLGGSRAAFDAAMLIGELRLRSPRAGDRVRPLGMSGHKKISDLLVDAKWPRIQRDEVVLLARDEEVIWVADLCIASDFRVRAKSQHIAYMEVTRQ